MARNGTPDTTLKNCQLRLGYKFKDPALLQAALTHSSSADHRRDSNERLEFLGDTVLGLVVCHTLFERLPEAQEGDLTKVKSAVVSRRICAEVGERIGLGEFLKLGQGMVNGEQLPRSLVAAALEAIIAAIYLDGGLDPAREFILRHMDEDIREASESEHQFNFKSQLQQHAQRAFGESPNYEMLDEKGPDHAKCFEVAVSVGRRQFTSAWGTSKKEAEQKAALVALRELGVLTDDDPEEPDFEDDE